MRLNIVMPNRNGQSVLILSASITSGGAPTLRYPGNG